MKAEYEPLLPGRPARSDLPLLLLLAAVFSAGSAVFWLLAAQPVLSAWLGVFALLLAATAAVLHRQQRTVNYEERN